MTAILAPANLIAGGETNFNNYVLPTSAQGLGAITPLTLTAAIVNTPTKTYNGATGAVLTASNFGLSGFVDGQGGDVSVNQTAGRLRLGRRRPEQSRLRRARAREL